MSPDGIEATVLELEVLDPEQIALPAITNAAEIEALAQRYLAEAETDLKMAQAVEVCDDAAYEQAGGLRVGIDNKRKGGEKVVEAVCGPLYKRWKEFRAWLQAPVDLRTQAAKVLSDKRLAYERKKQAEADRVRREQEEAARKEQARLDRLAAERAARAEAKGDTEKAEEIRQTVPQVPLPIPSLAPILPKVAGIAKQQYWFAEVTDLPALITAVAAGEVPTEAILANDAWLKKTASALKTAMKYPGVRVWDEWREKGTGR